MRGLRLFKVLRWCPAGLAVVWLILLAGCASTDDAANLSERPWNAPRSWEHGLPAGMFEGR